VSGTVVSTVTAGGGGAGTCTVTAGAGTWTTTPTPGPAINVKVARVEKPAIARAIFFVFICFDQSWKCAAKKPFFCDENTNGDHWFLMRYAIDAPKSFAFGHEDKKMIALPVI
jgi:hypothetical protein